MASRKVKDLELEVAGLRDEIEGLKRIIVMYEAEFERVFFDSLLSEDLEDEDLEDEEDDQEPIRTGQLM